MSQNRDTYRLWKHKNGIYYIQWSGETKPSENGRGSKRISTRATDRASAERFRAQFIAGLNNPTPVNEPTVGYVLHRYRRERGPHIRSGEALKSALMVLLPFFGHLYPSHVTNQLFRQFAEEHKYLSPGTIIRRLGVLKAALRYAEGNRWIGPLPPLRMPVAHPPPRDIWLTRADVEKLIDNAKSDHIRLFIKLAVFTAARSGAILDLTWPQVNFDTRIIDYGQGWGKKRRAIVPINDDLLEALKGAKAKAQTDYVIEYHGKRCLSVKIAFRRLCKECCIKASPHVLRHTAATWLVMDSVPLREVARLLGNSEAMVEKVYGKHSPDYLRRAVNALNLKKPSVLQV